MKKIIDNIEFVVPDGPWNQEVDYEVDFYEGIMYFLDRKDFGNWAGYVRIPEDHPLYKIKDYDEIPVEVHGGLTFAENKPAIWSLRNEEDIEKLELFGGKNWLWIGFDCAHYEDLIPYLGALEEAAGINLRKFKFITRPLKTYRDINFARQECFSMIDQMKRNE